MSRLGCLLLVLVLAGTQIAEAQTNTNVTHPVARLALQDDATATATPVTIPTVSLPQSTPISVPTVSIPPPTPTATPKPRKKHRARHTSHAVVEQWIWAYLTSYCPGSAGWLSSSGQPVFYGMLANDFFRFGTRVFIPVLGMNGVVEDRIGAYSMWNHFDVWSPTCYGTPTGWFRVAILP